MMQVAWTVHWWEDGVTAIEAESMDAAVVQALLELEDHVMGNPDEWPLSQEEGAILEFQARGPGDEDEDDPRDWRGGERTEILVSRGKKRLIVPRGDPNDNWMVRVGDRPPVATQDYGPTQEVWDAYTAASKRRRKARRKHG